MAKRLMAKTGTYEKDGEQKGEWQEIGVILNNDKGEYALIDPCVNLAGVAIKQRLMNPGKGNGSVMCSIFTDEPRQQAPQGSANFDDDLAF